MDILNAENVDYTISGINKAYTALACLPATDDFPNPELEAARFIVTGYNHREVQRARIEPLHHALLSSSDLPVPLRDLDSLIGFTDEIPIRDDLYVYALANPRDQLTKKVGVLVKFFLPRKKKTLWLDPACVPHVSLARFQQFHMIRILFPGLYERRCQVTNYSTNLMNDELASIYNEGIRPAISDVLKNSVHEWPASYDAEIFRSRFHAKGFANSTRAIPAEKVYEFGERLKYHLSKNLPWARNIVFQTQVRGVKLAYRHSCTPEDSRKALLNLLRPLDTRSGKWWIDIGLEFLDYGRALLWRTDASHHLVAAALEIRLHEASNLTGSSSMQVDPSSHFTSLSGFRLKIKHSEAGGKFESPFIQAYTTDKQVTYNPEKGYYGKFVTPKMAMKGVPPVFCSSLLKAYQDARENVDVAARIEVRVPLKYSLIALMGVPDEVLRMALVSMRRSVWWDFRISRLHGATTLLAAMNQMPKEIRTELPTLQTYAGLCFFINGLHSRSLDDRTGRLIAKCIFPLTSNLQDANRLTQQGELLTANDSIEGIPYAPGGMVWLRHITVPPESDRISFPISRPIDPYVFKRYFGVDEQKFRERIAGKPLQVKQKNARVGTYLPPLRETLELALPTSETPIQLANESGDSDVEDISPSYVEPSDARIDRLFSMCLINLLEVMGASLREHADYVVPSLDERQSVVLADYQTSSLGHIFSRFQWKKAKLAEWKKSFDALFPSRNFRFGAKVVHHYNRLTYRDEWKEWMGTLSEKEEKDIRNKMYLKFNELAWIPHTQTDRVWVMLPHKNFAMVANDPALEKAPRILWSPKRKDSPTLSVSRTIQLVFEEEEESEEEQPTNIDQKGINTELCEWDILEDREQCNVDEGLLPALAVVAAGDSPSLNHLIQSPADLASHSPQKLNGPNTLAGQHTEWYHDSHKAPLVTQFDEALAAYALEGVYEDELAQFWRDFSMWDRDEKADDEGVSDESGSLAGYGPDEESDAGRSSLPPEDVGQGFTEDEMDIDGTDDTFRL